MKRILLLAICLFSLHQVNGQTPNLQWAKQFGGPSSASEGTSITLDQLGNVYTTGSFMGVTDFDPGPGTYTLSSAGGRDIFISKLDASGNFIWVKQFGGTGDDYGTSIFIDPSNNIYTTGYFYYTADFDPGPGTYTFTSPGQDIFISKLNASGNFVWAAQIGGVAWNEYSTSITVDALGNVLTTGFFASLADFDPGPGTYTMTVPGSWGADEFISKLDASGNFVWAKQMVGSGDMGGHSITTDASGNVYTTGVFQTIADFDPGVGTYTLDGSVTGSKDIFISKLDASGNFVWAKQMVGTSYDQGHSIKLDAAGNIYSTGIFGGTDDFDPGPGTYTLTSSGAFDVYVSKLDASGNFVWAKGFGGVNDDWGLSLAVDGSGNVYTTGQFKDTVDFDPGPGTFTLASSNAYTDDIFISKLNPSGNFVWALQIGDTASDVGNSITVDACGNVYTTGSFRYSPDFDPALSTYTLAAFGWNDAFIHKIDQGCGVGINELISQNEINLFPNPTSNSIFILSDRSNFQNSKLEIINSIGQIVLKSEFKNQIDVSELASGFYTLLLKDNSGSVITKKFVKE